MRAMRKQYGEKEGEKVFYASKNKGTISGVEKNEESKMSYLDKVLSISEEEKKQKGLGTPADLMKDIGVRAVKAVDTSKAGKRKRPMSLPPQQRLQPLKKPNQQNSHTEYKRIGALMAEALGYRVDEMLPAIAAAGRMAGKMIGTVVKKKAADKAAEMAKDKVKKGLMSDNRSE